MSFMKDENELWDYVEGKFNVAEKEKMDKLLNADKDLFREFTLIKEVHMALKEDTIPKLPDDFLDATLERCLSVPLPGKAVRADNRVIISLFACLFLIFITALVYGLNYSNVTIKRPVFEYGFSSTRIYMLLMVTFAFSFFIAILFDHRYSKGNASIGDSKLT